MPSGGGGHTALGRRGAQAIEIHDSTHNAAIGKKRRAFSTYATTGSLFLKTLKIPIRQIKVFRALGGADAGLPRATSIPYSTPAKAAKALASGKVDFVIHDAPVLWRITADNPTAPYRIAPKLLTRESLA